MKKNILSGLLLITLMLTVISANPTQSQKQHPVDTVPAAKLVDTVPAPLADRITILEDKVKGVEKSLDDDIKRADRMLYQVGSLQARQGQILASFQKRDVKVLAPISDVQIKTSPETPEIKPVTPTRASWWKRVFNHEKD